MLIDPLRAEFGRRRATVGTAVSINVLLFGFVGPFAAAGALHDASGSYRSSFVLAGTSNGTTGRRRRRP